jgi:uncharacterized protein (TIGR02246 family)
LNFGSDKPQKQFDSLRVDSSEFGKEIPEKHRLSGVGTERTIVPMTGRSEDIASNAAPRTTSHESADRTAIIELLGSYEKALNASSTDAALALYAPDGVFMDCFSPSAVGADAVRREYDAVFKALTLRVKFQVIEMEVVSAEWAFAKTNSAGTVTIHSTGMTRAEGNQELFIFRKRADGAWKIARYCFSPTSPH